MITFYRTKHCKGCQGIQTILEEMTLAHEVVIVEKSNEDIPGLPPGIRPPAMMDDKELIKGKRAIFAHLEEMEGFKEQWYKFQSDACYCDEEGNII